MTEIHDPDLQAKARRGMCKVNDSGEIKNNPYNFVLLFLLGTGILSENLHFVANEPSLAFYRLQEHVRKSVPPMIEKRVQVQKLHKDLQGHNYDVEYALG